ncbi:MAG: hypothetical protein K2G52_07630 [Muribaculaceae bacterium]|nr:hypothetical protein [Muribaculaceae bacterium]
MGLLASVVAVIAGVGSFSAASAVAIALVFVGVDLVTRSKAGQKLNPPHRPGMSPLE